MASRRVDFTDMRWVAQVAERYGLADLELQGGSVFLEYTKQRGGQTHFFVERNRYGEKVRSCTIGLSIYRFNLVGRIGMEGILAHELLHAWLWVYAGCDDHGDLFVSEAEKRGIPLCCSAYEDDVAQYGAKQLALV